MPRKPIRSRKIARPVLLDFVAAVLMDGSKGFKTLNAQLKDDQVIGKGKVEAFMMLKPGIGPGIGPDAPLKTRFALMFEAWQRHRDEILKIWKYEKRKGLPYGARMFDGKRT